MPSIDQETLALSQALIRLNTVDPPGNELAAAQVVARVLDAEGIPYELIEIGPGRANLLARVKGVGRRKSLVYSAHFDTIPADPAEWSRSPFGGEVADGRLHGRGATDMKAGMAAMVMAAVALKRSGAKLAGDLELALTAAENSNCLGAEKFVESGKLSDAGALLISEPSSLDNAPCFAEFVANSCITIANALALRSPTPIRGTATRMRPLNAPLSSYGARSTEMTSPSNAAFP